MTVNRLRPSVNYPCYGNEDNMILSLLKENLIGRNSKAAPFLLAFISVFIVIALYYGQNSFLEAFEAKTYDLRFRDLRGAIPPSPDIAIVAIDDKSIAELGRFRSEEQTSELQSPCNLVCRLLLE